MRPILIAACLYLGFLAHAQAASFSCARATQWSEQAVCHDTRLSTLDERLARAYDSARANAPDPDSLRADQQDWLAVRDRCADSACLYRAYVDRIDALEQFDRTATATNSETATEASAATTRDDCARLDAAIKTALDSRTPASALGQFGGRPVSNWASGDYAAFLNALGTCQQDPRIAPVLHAFPAEARALLSGLRDRVSSAKEAAQEPARVASVTTPLPVKRADPRTAAAHPTPPAQAMVTRPSATPAVAASEPPSHDSGLLGIVLVTWLAIVVIGVVAGFSEKIVVFRNYNDLALVFCIGVAWTIGLSALFMVGSRSAVIFAVVLCVAGIALGLVIVGRTLLDNLSIWAFPLALITKLSLASIFLLNLVTFISPGGKTYADRARARASAFGILLLLTPIVYRLVRDKTGFLAPADVLGSYHRRRLGV